MIIKKEKTIFIHVPKTGGTSVCTHFGFDNYEYKNNKGQQSKKHDSITLLKAKFPKEYDEYMKFSVVRNPYDRMVSVYFFITQSLPKIYKQFFENIDTTTVNFDFTFKEFLNDPDGVSLKYSQEMEKAMPILASKGFVNNSPHPRKLNEKFKYFMLKPQHVWVDESVKILKFENLQEEISELIPGIKLEHLNKSEHDHYLSYYDKQSLDLVYNRYEQDFKQFNYEKL